jgi:hypothetical protein
MHSGSQFVTQSRSCPSFGSREIVPYAQALGRQVAVRIVGPDSPFPLIAFLHSWPAGTHESARDRLMRMAAFDYVCQLSEIYLA